MEKTFSAELSSLYPILDWIQGCLKETALSDDAIGQIEVALEEGLVNIFSYAYQGNTGTIDIGVHHQSDYVEIVLKDSGRPFNPLKHKGQTDPLAPIESRKEGGLGILFMQKLMDQVAYQRENDTNILTLRKKLGT